MKGALINVYGHFFGRRRVTSRDNQLRCKLGLESLEKRELLAVVWGNKGTNAVDSDGFQAAFGLDFVDVARTTAQRAVDDWNAVIQSFNYAEDLDSNPSNDLNDVFDLTISALNLNNANRGQVQFASFSYNVNGSPTAATVELDDDAAGTGWFFDTTPYDDAEFTGIANAREDGDGIAFQGSFVDATLMGQENFNDLYRTIAHEIGHALGLTSDPNAAIANSWTAIVNEFGQQYFSSGDALWLFEGATADAVSPVVISMKAWLGRHWRYSNRVRAHRSTYSATLMNC